MVVICLQIFRGRYRIKSWGWGWGVGGGACIFMALLGERCVIYFKMKINAHTNIS